MVVFHLRRPRIVYLLSLLFRRVGGGWLVGSVGGWLEVLELKQDLQFCFDLGHSKNNAINNGHYVSSAAGQCTTQRSDQKFYKVIFTN